MPNTQRFTTKVQAALDGLHFDDDPDRDALQKLVQSMGKRRRNRILRAALQSHFEAEALKPYQAELIKMQAHLVRTGKKAIVLFDGRDASGKGGSLRRITRYMNEKHYRVVALGKPTEEQRTELHMKRYIEQFPHAGEVVMFDRSWYNRAMVEPVMGFCTRRQYRNFMKKVNEYEDSFVSDGNTVLIKVYFSVSKAEQAKRFDRRKSDPLRQWKLSEVDLQAQELWSEFTQKKLELLRQTHTEKNPWWIIRSDTKHLARMEAMKLMLRTIRYRGRSRSLDFSRNPNVCVRGDEELALMKAERGTEKKRRKSRKKRG